jgi:hypothetical protein
LLNVEIMNRADVKFEGEFTLQISIALKPLGDSLFLGLLLRGL